MGGEREGVDASGDAASAERAERDGDDDGDDQNGREREQIAALGGRLDVVVGANEFAHAFELVEASARTRKDGGEQGTIGVGEDTLHLEFDLRSVVERLAAIAAGEHGAVGHGDAE